MQDALANANYVVCLCHVNPDGDAVGSVSAMVSWLGSMGKRAFGVIPNDVPDNLRWLCDGLIVATKEPKRAEVLIGDADLIVMLDHNSPSRAGAQLEEVVRRSTAPRLMIDHHLHPEACADVCISKPEASSTCELVLELMTEQGYKPTPQEAEALLAGMMTDTGDFAYACQRPEGFRAAAQLLEAGAEKDAIYDRLFRQAAESRLRLMGYLLHANMQLFPEWHASLMTLTKQEYRHFNAKNGDTEGVVNMPLDIKGITVSIFLREDAEQRGKIRVSTRSLGDFPCNLMAAEFFNGGGHKNAAGGQLDMTLEEAVEVAKRALAKYNAI